MKKCGHADCETRVVGGTTYCDEHKPNWRDSRRVVPTDWKTRKARVLAAHARVCHICQHPDADQVDHIINVAAGGTHDPANLAPIHGQRCPTCGQRCHTAKTTAEAANGRAANRP